MDWIRPTVAVAGVSAVSTGISYIGWGPQVSEGPIFRIAKDIAPIQLWGVVFVALGLLVIVAALAWWEAVSWAMSLLTALYVCCSVTFAVCAIQAGGEGIGASISAVTLATLFWCLGVRASTMIRGGHRAR
jgi:hypothetical protein